MRIAVNTRLLLEDRLEGIGRFTYECLKRITTHHPENEFYFLFDRPYSSKFIFSKNITPIVLFPQARHPLLYYLYFEYSVPRILKKIKADCFLSTDGYMSLSTQVKTLNVIHDINFEHRPKDLPLFHRLYYRHFFPKFAKQASRIATVSEYSKKDICNTYQIPEDKVDVVYNGCNEGFRPISQDEISKTRYKYSSGRPYFLFVGSLHKRKNIPNMLKAFDRFKNTFPSDIKLLLAGQPMWDDSDYRDVYLNMKHKNEVVLLGRVRDSELKKIVASALALTYIPFFEGFGIPILEAMYCDVPVLTSNVTSLPEVAGDAALLVSPDSVEQISDAMLTIAQNVELRQDLIAKARIRRSLFSWDVTADKLWESLQKTISAEKQQ
ncbi:MAG: glycosyltransferase family 4 protein [Cytophagaceae bacterium]|nr:glycosyltransferase family 4 protein [Cytophagaceae bacterium]MDW8456597.1 glycosyltransferase family 1 protein [Cytophagaceae bacterium]